MLGSVGRVFTGMGVTNDVHQACVQSLIPSDVLRHDQIMQIFAMSLVEHISTLFPTIPT
jgi:hypothetical protein